MNGAVEIRDVTKTFDRHVAVNDLALTVPTGSVYGFIGPNGSGKTTSLRMIMGIIYPDPGSGSMQVLGKPVSRAANDRVGYMPEERGLYNKMKVRDILRFCAELKGHRDCRGDIDDWLGRLGLGDWSDKKVEALSKGMTQKVQFIASVIARPDILILDEPFTGLDPVNAEVVKDAILEVKRGGTTVILSTHDMNVAERMCDFIFMIFKGRKVLDGTLESIQDAYASDTIRVRVEGNGDVFGDLPGVERVNDFGHFQELRTTEQADPQAILHALAARARIRLFELARPSLNDIFVRIAGPEAQEAGHE
ncbi:MAG TPA: ATP-binding cassette domain-containing protein [Phycisphaerae bacterium]|nr:ATP-binding cassette domain-containing protein [Phycisphaerae bacterium]